MGVTALTQLDTLAFIYTVHCMCVCVFYLFRSFNGNSYFLLPMSVSHFTSECINTFCFSLNNS